MCIRVFSSYSAEISELKVGCTMCILGPTPEFFLVGWNCFLAGWSFFLAGWSLFVAGWSFFLAGWSLFLAG